MKRLFVLAVVVIMALAASSAAAGAQPWQSDGRLNNRNSGDNQNWPSSLSGLRLPDPRQVSGVTLEELGLSGSQARGPQQVVIHLKTEPVASLPAGEASDQQAHIARIENEQQQFLARLQKRGEGFQRLATLRLVLNAVIAEVDAALLPEVVNDPSVSHVTPVIAYELALSETVPYIGAPPVHDLGVDGSGVRVAVLDSGIDYTHANLGGPGTVDAYEAAYGASPEDPRNTTTDGLFPTDKVIGGYDFLGEFWPEGPAVPDPDPIDFNGHGTHVADIIGGRRGVAPGVDLYAIKVCASLAGACSGAALLQAVEFAVDPNGDGNTDDHVDIINMSLGAGYGQPFDDSLSAAVDNATLLGVLTVAAAGNGSDRPYITATPGAAATAISVAETQMPSAFLPTISVIEPGAFRGEYPAPWQPWSAPLPGVIEGPVQYADGRGGNLDGCAPFEPDSLEGKIVVVDRGACFFSDKIRHIQLAGGILGIIALVTPGPPFEGGFGGGPPITIPAYMVSKSDGDILRRGHAIVRLAPGQGIPLVGSVVDTSSRGPELQGHRIKPELAAPGASVSAEPGTGAGERPFGGTSGATPVVAGSAALLMDSHRGELENEPEVEGLERVARLTPWEVKARLMNTAESNLSNSPDGTPAPISRVGGGEVRIDQAVASPVAAWDDQHLSGALSFGFIDVADEHTTLTRKVRLRNYSREKMTFELSYSHRFADDTANGAVTLTLPETVTVDGQADVVFPVVLNIDGSRLRNNLMNSGPQGNDPVPLTINEYDGYITLDGGRHSIELPWHVLPRKSARLVVERAQPSASAADFGAFTLLNPMELTNRGVGVAQNEAYSLLALSPRLQPGGRGQGAPTPDLRAVGVKTFDVPVGFCSGSPSYVLAFAVNTWRRQTHANWPGALMFHLDTDQDGFTNYTVFNGDSGLQSEIAQGQNMTWVLDWKTREMSARFFTEHAMNTANTVLYLCAEQIGRPPPPQKIDVVAEAVDAYFGGPGDSIFGITFAPSGPGLLWSSPPDIPAGSTDFMEVIGITEVSQSPTGPGLLVFTNSDRGPASRGGATADTEALVFLTPEMEGTPPGPAVLGRTPSNPSVSGSVSTR